MKEVREGARDARFDWLRYAVRAQPSTDLVRPAGTGGPDIMRRSGKPYLGKYDSPESHREYERLIAQ